MKFHLSNQAAGSTLAAMSL